MYLTPLQNALVGTWAAASWTIYQKEGYRLVSDIEKDRLLRRYWRIPERQVETSVVLAYKRWLDAQAGLACIKGNERLLGNQGSLSHYLGLPVRMNAPQ